MELLAIQFECQSVLNRCLSTWFQAHSREQHCAVLMNDAVSQHSCRIVESAFVKWHRLSQCTQTQLEYARLLDMSHYRSLKRRSLNIWILKRHSLKLKQKQALMHHSYMDTSRSLNSKYNLYNHWRYLYLDRRIARIQQSQAQQNHRQMLGGKVWDAWTQFVRDRKQERVRERFASEYYSYALGLKAMLLWQLEYRKHANLRNFKQVSQQFYEIHKMSGALNAMRILYLHRMARQHDLDRLCDLFVRARYVRLAFGLWPFYHRRLVELDAVGNDFNQSRISKNYMMMWEFNLDVKRTDNHNETIANRQYTHSLTKVCFSDIKAKFQELKSMNVNAVKYYVDSERNIYFKWWRSRTDDIKRHEPIASLFKEKLNSHRSMREIRGWRLFAKVLNTENDKNIAKVTKTFNVWRKTVVEMRNASQFRINSVLLRFLENWKIRLDKKLLVKLEVKRESNASQMSFTSKALEIMHFEIAKEVDGKPLADQIQIISRHLTRTAIERDALKQKELRLNDLKMEFVKANKSGLKSSQSQIHLDIIQCEEEIDEWMAREPLRQRQIQSLMDIMNSLTMQIQKQLHTHG